MLANKKHEGQAALPAVLLIGGIIIEIGIAGAFIAFILSSSGWGERLSAQALSAAKAGVEDAFIKITISKNFVPSPNPYSFAISGSTVEVSVAKDPAGYPTGRHKVTSTGKALSRQRKLEAIIVVDKDTGKVDLELIKEIE